MGFLSALALLIPTDIGPTTVVGVFCPPFVVVAAAIRLLKIDQLPVNAYRMLAILTAAGNALWYMLLIEAIRMSLLKLSSAQKQ
jgi:hypothetical protein